MLAKARAGCLLRRAAKAGEGLGWFVEGEGCFSINRGNNYRLDFSLTQTYSNLELIKKIKVYLENLPNTNGNYAGAIGISSVVSKNPNQQSVIRIETTRIAFITDIFIPFLDSLN